MIKLFHDSWGTTGFITLRIPSENDDEAEHLTESSTENKPIFYSLISNVQSFVVK